MGLRWQSRRTGAHLSHKSEKLQQTPEQYSTKQVANYQKSPMQEDKEQDILR